MKFWIKTILVKIIFFSATSFAAHPCFTEYTERMGIVTETKQVWQSHEFINTIQNRIDAFTERGSFTWTQADAVQFINQNIVNQKNIGVPDLVGFLLATFSKEDRAVILQNLARNLQGRKVLLLRQGKWNPTLFTQKSGNLFFSRGGWFWQKDVGLVIREPFSGANFTSQEQVFDALNQVIMHLHSYGHRHYSEVNTFRYLNFLNGSEETVKIALNNALSEQSLLIRMQKILEQARELKRNDPSNGKLLQFLIQANRALEKPHAALREAFATYLGRPVKALFNNKDDMNLAAVLKLNDKLNNQQSLAEISTSSFERFYYRHRVRLTWHALNYTALYLSYVQLASFAYVFYNMNQFSNELEGANKKIPEEYKKIVSFDEKTPGEKAQELTRLQIEAAKMQGGEGVSIDFSEAIESLKEQEKERINFIKNQKMQEGNPI